MHVVATAGHVDHGKSSLLRVLTGADPDRLAEEKRRGLTIELGHVHTWVDGVGEVAFVDVPGHERFLPTMLAGVGSVPVVLFVVAADDPWMPQAAEHAAALAALGVRHGVLALTRCDLADPAPALAAARAGLAGTSLEGLPAVAVSARTGAGTDALREALATVLSALPVPDPAADVRLWVDRAFRPRGAGLVVTGTLPAGTVTVGDRLDADGVPVRVRALETLGRRVERVSGPARVALDLGAADGVQRGSALATPSAFADAAVVDVEVTGPRALPREPVLHVGSAALGVAVRVLGPDGPDPVVARLRLERALPWHVGDRAVLRDPGDRTLWSVRVLDPEPPQLPRRRGAAAERAGSLRRTAGAGVDGELARRGLVHRDRLRRLGLAGSADGLPTDALVVGSWLVAPGHAERVRGQVRERVAAAAAPERSSGRPGLALRALARDLGLPDAGVLEGVLADDPGLRVVAGSVSPAAAPSLPPRLATAAERLRELLRDAPFTAPDADTLAELRLTPSDLAVLAREQEVLRVAETVVLLPGADDRAVEVLAGLPSPFTTSEARKAWGTSRRVALPLLAHLDRTGRTLRLPDDRRRLR